MSYDSLTNRGDYLSPHYLAEVLPRELAKKDGLRAQWAQRDKEGTPSPVRELRALKRGYFAARPDLADFAQRAADGDPVTEDERRSHDKAVKKQNDDVLRALGFDRCRAVSWTWGDRVRRSACRSRTRGRTWSRWTAAGPPTPTPRSTPTAPGGCSTRSRPGATSGSRPAPSWSAGCSTPTSRPGTCCCCTAAWSSSPTASPGPRAGTSRSAWTPRSTAPTSPSWRRSPPCSAPTSLQPPAEGGTEQLAHWVDESRKHAVGVSAELREGLRESVQIIANEVLDRIRSHGLAPGDIAEPGDLARELGRDALRYLYRILFLLYAEARPELGILPADDQDYVAGYSMQRLGELVARRLIGEEARTGFHLYESLDLLFRMVNNGHRRAREREHGGPVRGRGAPVRVAQGRPVRAVQDPAHRPHPRPPLRRRNAHGSTPGCGTRPCTRCCAG